MKTVCIYHSIDLDGWMSAAIVKHWFKTNNKSYSISDISSQKELIEKEKVSFGSGNIDFSSNEKVEFLDFIGYNYGQPIPDLSEYDKVIMCDISFPKDEMTKLFTEKKNLISIIWIDHHISAIKDNKELFINDNECGLRDTKFAACELTWKYFFPNDPMPEIVRLLGRYDCFGHKGTNEEIEVLEFQYGARAYIKNYEDAYEYLLKTIGTDLTSKMTLEFIHTAGKSIYKYLCTEAKQTYNNGFPIVFWNKTQISGEPDRWYFICINKERFNPINFGIDYHKEGYDGAACFHRTKDGKWAFSLYNDNGLVDCSQIAKQFGGGGHKGAAGFIVNDLSKVF